MHARSWLIAVFATLTSCGGTTGGETIDFHAEAAGPADAQAGQPLEFVSDRGFAVTLTTATLHVGAIYLNRSMPVSGAQNTNCILPSTYVAEVTTGLDVDLLSPDPQPFAVPGEGTTLSPAIVAQVWLTGARIDLVDDPTQDGTPILHVEGVATKDGVSQGFSGRITIRSNRLLASTDATQAGAAPICKQRIVSPIPTFITLQNKGALLLRMDPRRLFINVDFSLLPPSGDTFAFTDDVGQKDQPSVNLYNNLRSAGGLYSFEWVP